MPVRKPDICDFVLHLHTVLSWESKPMIEKESGCVTHENAFVNTCQVSFLWLLKPLGTFQLWKFVKIGRINVYLVRFMFIPCLGSKFSTR